ncbi:SP_0009 family protein [Streptococcus gordonii]|nr:SP_0009 family protein [Streptococcus gordonii]MBX9096795.1 recombinase [Streptococcus gordonii]MBZ2132462.1 recombinase [Streptococcus gordonii]MBZ2140869.1 recombinase [Streptococcus gordonii]MBZ2144009.1 recombinase [Streptococcus gordonii]MBZ2145620.1 recombinase [Streptococcus gordonii]
MDNIVKTVEKFLTFSEEKLEELSQKNQELREKNTERKD